MVTAAAAVVVIPTTTNSRGFFFLFSSPALRLVRLLFLLSLSNIACPGRTATAAADASSASASYLNVYGKPLQPCSTNGTALTGYTRNGYCVERNDDSGSHHICLNLNTTTLTTTTDDDDDNNYNYNNKNNIYYQNFCDVTCQDDDWCSAQDMPCHDNPEDESCAIEYWCVCQWAFASYLEKIGGCNAIQQQQQQQDDNDIIIQCNAINIEAVRAYKSTRGFDTALACLVEQCGLHPNSSIYNMPAVNKNEQAWRRFASLSLVVAVTATLATFVYKNRHQKWRSCHNSPHQEVLLVSNNVGNVRNNNNNNHKVALLSSEEEDYYSSIQHHHHDHHHHHHGDPKSTGSSNHDGGSSSSSSGRQARRHPQKIAPI